MTKPLELAHSLLAEVIKPDDIVIDATMGNGHDTVFLARLCWNVIAFDVQERAIAATRARLEGEGLADRVKLVHDGHENVGTYLNETLNANDSVSHRICEEGVARRGNPESRIKAAIFNLGYLPGSDKRVTTRGKTTIIALRKIAKKLEIGGRITIMVYPGHDAGAEEAVVVREWASSLSQSEWQVVKYEHMNQANRPPFLICVERVY